VDGVAKVSLSGLQDPEVSILFSASTLAAFDLRPEDIRAAVAGQSDVVGLGVHDAGQVDVELVEGSVYSSVNDIDNQLLMAADGKQYRLGDVARVVRGYSEPAEYILKVDGRRSVGVAIAAREDMDVVSVGDAIAAVVATTARLLPAGLEVVALYPEGEIAHEATNTFIVNLMESVAIVILLVMIAMGWRAGIIVGVSLVLSICGTLLLMLFVGEGLNRTSLAGFIIAMGMLVDNAIVVVDNTSRYLRGGMLLRSAAVAGATQPRLGLLAATLIAILSFLPLQLAPSSVAEIIRPLFVVIALSLLLSWLLAITQVPAMSLGMLRVTTAPRDGGVAALFGRAVAVALRHRWVTVGVAVLLLVGSLVAMRYMPQNFFPQLSKPLFRADVILADGLDIDATQQRLDAMTEWLMAQREVRRVSTTAGGTPPRYYLASGSYANRPNYGNILVETSSADVTAAVEARFDEWVSATMPDVWLRSSLFRLSPTPEATIEFGFVGDDVDSLALYSDAR
jgi:multidrug efflux pump subunit AcrB